MSETMTITKRTVALAAAAAVTAACGAAAVTLAQPANAEAATATVQAKNATVNVAKNAKVKGKGLKVTVQKSGGRVATVQLELTGKKAKTSNLWYRVYAKGYGWMGWAENGAKAGSLAKGAYAAKIQTAVIARSAKGQMNADRAAYSAKNGFMTKITGDKKTDATIKKVAKKNGMDLKKCYNWAHGLGYASSGVKVTEHKTMSKAHQNAIAKFAFSKNMGDCYGSNVAFAKLATYLGYSTNVYLGQTERVDGTVANPEYGWAVVKTAGQWNIYDSYQGKNYNVGKNSPAYKQYVRK